MFVGKSEQRSVEADASFAGPTASEAELVLWVESVIGGTVTSWRPISGGNRCQSWAVGLSGATRPGVYLRYQPPRPPSAEPYTVWREAEIYRLVGGSATRAPRLLAVHPDHQAIITELKPGRADFRSLEDTPEKMRIAFDFIEAIAHLHRLKIPAAPLLGFAEGMTIADSVRAELDNWYAMYSETGSPDPLTEFAMEWLSENVPEPTESPVLVHGDAGPGNFLFEEGEMTALIDWELAHPGDPMEDLAWFSMRNVMEPVPDFLACIRHYEAQAGRPVDLQRILYHRVFVSARVVIIRHRNVTGLPGNSIVSRALNRRLLVDALAEATGVKLAAPSQVEAADTSQTALYDGVLDALRDDIASVSRDNGIVAAAKNSAKVVKFLREIDRLGPLVAQSERAGLAGLLGHPVTKLRDGRDELLARIRAKALSFDAVLKFFAEAVAHDAQLAALTSGGLASRQLPSLDRLRDEP